MIQFVGSFSNSNLEHWKTIQVSLSPVTFLHAQLNYLHKILWLSLLHLICYGDLSVCQFWSQSLNRKNKANYGILSFLRSVSFCKLIWRFSCLSLPVKTGCQQVHCRIKMCRKTYGRKVNLHSFSFSLKYAVFILGTCEQISECGLEER